MGKRRIHIENLRIRLPHGLAANAGSIAGGLGHEVMKRIAHASRGKSGRMRIDQLSAQRIKSDASAADIRTRAAEVISAEVNKRLG